MNEANPQTMAEMDKDRESELQVEKHDPESKARTSLQRQLEPGGMLSPH